MSRSAHEPVSVAVGIPTRSRPAELSRCLESLAAARLRLSFHAYVCDSSPAEEDRIAVRKVCEGYDWVTLAGHDGRNVAAARNACARAAREDLLIDVDDDLELEPEAIERLVARYREGTGRRVVAGSISWGGEWTTPVRLRPVGYGRPVRNGEDPDFVAGALILYPRSFALAWPWNERIVTSDDIFMGALWRSKGVQMLFAPDARANHPELPASFDPARIGDEARNQRWHIYALLFDALIANPSARRAISYEILGFLASAKLYLRRPRRAITFLRSWIAGHRQLLADRQFLRELIRREPPDDAR